MVADITSWQLYGDFSNVALLVVLYLYQGVVTGLAFGSLPFMLVGKASYAEVGVFSFATWPYSLKLLWSPVVDSCFNRSFGRRRSWIVPMQTLIALALWHISADADAMVGVSGEPQIAWLTVYFFLLVTLAATQDIAVDGWALELLSQRNLAYAATCQTVGLNCGFFMSFTIFLAFNSADFSNKYLRSPENAQTTGVVTLSGYLRFWAVAFIALTLFLTFFKSERGLQRRGSDDPSRTGDDSELALLGPTSSHVPASPVTEHEFAGLKDTYMALYKTLKLPSVMALAGVLLVSKVGFAAADKLAVLELLDRGFKREDLGILTLVQFPFELIFAVITGKWASGSQPLAPWSRAYVAKVALGPVAALVVYLYSPDIPGFGVVVLGLMLLSSFCTNVMFTAMGSFFARIGDPSIGGSYLTLLNTISNMGGTWPQSLVLFIVQPLTRKGCADPAVGVYDPASKQMGGGGAVGGGEGGCVEVVTIDGFYVVTAMCFVAGTFIYVVVLRIRLVVLQRIPSEGWRINWGRKGSDNV